jgi:demethylmenaquinone methyltransferase/2-methoxy-6-polyprenyl-1,4-benzoquinol methylase
MAQGNVVNQMFSGIASRYDLANRVLSFGLCVLWRNRLITKVAELNPKEVVDLATGSGDVAMAMSQTLPSTTKITGYDFCEPMLDIARNRATRENKSVKFLTGDCMNLPIPDASCEAVTIAYGVRNFENRERGLKELARITQNKGTVFILEFSQPSKLFWPLHFIHVRIISPILAGLLTGDFGAYRYLGSSIADFANADGLTTELKKAGFSEVDFELFLCGTVALHRAKK